MVKYKGPLKNRALKNIFSDRSSRVLRALLREPEKKWVTKDFVREGVSLGLASGVLTKAEAAGYVERVMKGPESYTRLIRKEALLKDWLTNYSFEQNEAVYYLSTEKSFLKNCTAYLKEKKINFSLTLYSASRLISPYVQDDRHFLYLDLAREDLVPILKEMEKRLSLYKLVQGGNVGFILPYYRSSVFKDVQKLKGYPAVSSLQLYLDLMIFPPTGREEASHLVSHFKKKGQRFV